MKMNIIKVTTRAQLDELYKDWSLTIEGLAPDEANLKELLTFANAAASLVTTKKGALCVMPTVDQVQAYIKESGR